MKVFFPKTGVLTDEIDSVDVCHEMQVAYAKNNIVCWIIHTK